MVLSSEIDRENESFFDNGSKTLLFRPFQRKAMTRIEREYRGQPSPTAVDLLRDLADAGEYDRVAAELDAIWCDVLRDHLKRKNSPPRGVVQAFLSIHALRG